MNVGDLALRGIAAIGLFAGACALAPDARAGGAFTYTTIDVPGSLTTVPLAVNNSDQVVGYYVKPATRGRPQPFIWQGGAFTLLGGSFADGILQGVNNAGIAVGGGRYGAFVADATSGSGRVLLHSDQEFLVAVNSSNVAVGVGSSAALIRAQGVRSKVHGLDVLLGIDDAGVSFGYLRRGTGLDWFTYAGGQLTPVPFPAGSLSGDVASIAPDGALVGNLLTGSPGVRQGFVDTASSFEVIAFRNAPTTYTTAVAMDRTGGLFGEYSLSESSRQLLRAFVRRNGIDHPLDPPPGARQVQISAVSGDGSFVGSYSTPDRAALLLHGFIATCTADQRPCVH